MEIKTRENRTDRTQKYYKCPCCPKLYKRWLAFQKHMEQHPYNSNLLDCDECDRRGLTEFGLHLHKKYIHCGEVKTEKTVNNNNVLPAIDGFKIFESKKPTCESFNCVQVEIPLSPYSDDCSMVSVDSSVSTSSVCSSNFETFTYPDETMSNEISSTGSVSSLTSDVRLADCEKKTHDKNEEIIKILRNEMEKNIVDVLLGFSEY